MTRIIKLAEYHNEPIVVIEMAEGENWRIRQPAESDIHLTNDVLTHHRQRLTEYLEARAKDDAGPPPAELPLEFTGRYLTASLVGVFLEPKQSPEHILDVLGPGMLNELNEEITQVISGEAAKKNLRRSL